MMHLRKFAQMMFPDYKLSKPQIEILDSRKPSCFQKYPHGSFIKQEENGCADCPFNHTCFEYSVTPRQ